MASIRYLRPFVLFRPRHDTETAEEKILVTDARRLAESGEQVFSLETNGFILTHLETQCPRFEEKDLVRKVYYPEILDLVKRSTGCEHAAVISHLVVSVAQALCRHNLQVAWGLPPSDSCSGHDTIGRNPLDLCAMLCMIFSYRGPRDSSGALESPIRR